MPDTISWIDPERARTLEREGRHEELAREATAALRIAIPNKDVEVVWEGMWVRRVGAIFFPDPFLFATATPPFARWRTLVRKYLRDAHDYWFHVYRPNLGDTIVDIGAGRGEDVFAFSQSVGKAGRVWAIEPHPQSFAVLQKFCQLNQLENVRTLRYACVDREERLQIETLPVWESNYVRTGQRTASSYPVKGVTFDSLCGQNAIDRIDFLKMNIEGAEMLALPGCAQALKRTQNVCVSAHDFRANRGEGEAFRTLRFVREFLTVAGFELTTRDEDPRYYVPFHVHGVRNRSLRNRSFRSRT